MRLLSVAFAAVLIALTTFASATPGRVVAIVRGYHDTETVGRLVAELSALGFDVTELEAPGPRQDLALALASVPEAVALLYPVQDSEIRIWVRNPATGESAFEVVTSERGGDPELLALHAVEVLRARLVRLGVPEHGSPAPAPRAAAPKPKPAPKREPAPPQPQPRSVVELWLEAGAQGGYSPGGLGFLPLVELGPKLVVARPLTLHAFVALPLSASEIAQPEGTARVSPWLLGVVARWSLLNDAWRLAAGPGAGIAALGMSGDTQSAAYETQDLTLLTGLVFADLSLERRLGDRFQLVSRLSVGSALPRAVVRFADRDVAYFGRPYLGLTLGVDFGVLVADAR